MKRDWFFWIIVLLIIIGIPTFAYVYFQGASMVEEQVKELSTMQQGELSLFQQRVSALLTITVLLIGGAGALLLHFHEKNTGSRTQHRLAVVAVVAAALSAFAGYLTNDAAIWMLRVGYFNLESLPLKILSLGQLWMSAIAVVCLVWCFLSASNTTARR